MKTVRKFLSFSAIGAVMTILTLATNILILKFLNTPLIPTYIVVYSVSVILSYLLNTTYTFRAEISVRNASVYFGAYLLTMGLGTLLYSILPELIQVKNWQYPLFVLPVTATSNFLLNHLFIRQAFKKAG